MVLSLQLIEQCTDKHCSGCPNRVPKGDRSAIGVQLAVIDAQMFHEAQWNNRKSFVYLKQIHVGNGEAAPVSYTHLTLPTKA